MAGKKEKQILTSTGLKKFEDELNDLRVRRRKEVAQKIKEAREQGDLSENAEYDAAMDEQRDIEARIVELEELLKNVEVIDEDEIDLETVNVGCTVVVKNTATGAEKTYQMVGSTEANFLKGKISNESPVGQALMGAKLNSDVKVELPAGPVIYHICSINRTEN